MAKSGYDPLDLYIPGQSPFKSVFVLYLYLY